MKKTSLGQGLIGSLNEALEHARGRKILRTSDVELPPPPPKWTPNMIVALRKKSLGVSQTVFASFLNVSGATVRSWEQGLKTPSGPAQRLLQVLKHNPRSLMEPTMGRP